MNPEKINMLRKEITSGRLRNFEVVSFPDKFAGVVPVYYLFKFSFYLFNFVIAIPFEDIVSIKCNILQSRYFNNTI